MSAISFVGSPWIRTRSACLPAATIRSHALSSPGSARRSRSRCGLPRGGETGFDEALYAALVAEPGEHAAVAGWIFSRQEQSARLHERSLELHLFIEQFRARIVGGLGVPRSGRQVVRTRLGREGIQNALREWRAIRDERLEDR